MISLKKREQISTDSLKVEASSYTGTSEAGSDGAVWFALLIVSFCCRFCQMTLLSCVHLASPGNEWLSPEGALLLLPAVVVTVQLALLCAKFARQLLIASLAALACLLAITSLLMGAQIAPAIVLVTTVTLLAVGAESARVSTFAQMTKSTSRKNSDQAGTYLLLIELIAITLAIYCWQQAAETLTVGSAMRGTALALVSGSAILYYFVKPQHVEATLSSEKMSPEKVNFFPVGFIGLSAVLNAPLLCLLALTTAGKVVASISLCDYWSPVSIGMISGALFSLLRGSKQLSWSLILAISVAASLLCIFKPAGSALIVGLFVSGFAAVAANINFYQNILSVRHTHSPTVLLGYQTTLSSAIALSISLVLGPKLESISTFVFVRALSASQLLLLVVLAGISYIIYKYRRTQS